MWELRAARERERREGFSLVWGGLGFYSAFVLAVSGGVMFMLERVSESSVCCKC